jgi:sulfite exporter TauE/SafE
MSQHPLLAALLMFCFGLGTLPAMLATSLGAGKIQQFLRKRGLKLFIGIFLVAAGAWTLYLTYAHAGHFSQQSHDLHGDHSSHGSVMYNGQSHQYPFC